VFQWGLSQALWREATRARLVGRIDRYCPQRRQGLTTGQYLAIAAINRAISPRSKRSMWDWFSQTVLRRRLSSASQAALSSQRFWDQMDAVKPEAATAIWKDLVKDVVDRERIDLSSICCDGTNFYTFLKGNNSADNFGLLDSLSLKFVGSVKQNEHPELAQVPHTDPRFIVCASSGLKGAKAFRVTESNRPRLA
jgi:hypothetical protein